MNLIFKILVPLALLAVFAGCDKEQKRNTSFPPMPNEQNTSLARQIQYVSGILEQDASNPGYYYRRAGLLLEAGRLTTAAQDLQKAILLNGREPAYHYLYARVLRNDGKYQQALAEAEQALEGGIDQPGLNLLMGELYHLNQQDSLAIPWLKKAIASLPEGHLPWFYLGTIYTSKSDTALAGQHLRQAIARQPGYLPAVKQLLQLYNKGGFYKQSLALAGTTLKTAEPDARFSYLAATALEQTGQRDSAMIWYGKAVEKDENLWQAHLQLARFYFKEVQVKESENHYLKALEVKPAIKNGYYELGYLYEYYTKDLDKALSAYQTGAEADTTNQNMEWYIRRVQRKINFRNFASGDTDL